MAIRNIIKRGDPLLAKRAREVTEFDVRLHTLLDDMLATLHKSEGVGIAAPQVGVLRRVVIVEPPKQAAIELVNPVILSAEGESEDREGCLKRAQLAFSSGYHCAQSAFLAFAPACDLEQEEAARIAASFGGGVGGMGEIWGVVKRPTKVVCRAQDRNGKTFTFTATGYAARIVCHETDHLEGTLFTDKVSYYVDENGDPIK